LKTECEGTPGLPSRQHLRERWCWNDDFRVLLLKGLEKVRHSLVAAVNRIAGGGINRRLGLLVDYVDQDASVECDDQ
jgi:hypothetical protein